MSLSKPTTERKITRVKTGEKFRHLTRPSGENYNGRYTMGEKKRKKKRKEKKKEEKKKKGKADLTTVLRIRELPHLHMELAVWFSFPSTNNKNPMIPS